MSPAFEAEVKDKGSNNENKIEIIFFIFPPKKIVSNNNY